MLDACEVPGVVLIREADAMSDLDSRLELWEANSGKPTTEDTQVT